MSRYATDAPAIVYRSDGEPLYFFPDPYGVLRCRGLMLKLTPRGVRVWDAQPFVRHRELPGIVRVEFPDGSRYDMASGGEGKGEPRSE